MNRVDQTICPTSWDPHPKQRCMENHSQKQTLTARDKKFNIQETKHRKMLSLKKIRGEPFDNIQRRDRKSTHPQKTIMIKLCIKTSKENIQRQETMQSHEIYVHKIAFHFMKCKLTFFYYFLNSITGLILHFLFLPRD